jgi:hypothetical protein
MLRNVVASGFPCTERRAVCEAISGYEGIASSQKARAFLAMTSKPRNISYLTRSVMKTYKHLYEQVCDYENVYLGTDLTGGALSASKRFHRAVINQRHGDSRDANRLSIE